MKDNDNLKFYTDVKRDLRFDPLPVMQRDLSWQALTQGALKATKGTGKRQMKGQ